MLMRDEVSEAFANERQPREVSHVGYRDVLEDVNEDLVRERSYGTWWCFGAFHVWGQGFDLQVGEAGDEVSDWLGL